MNGIKNFLSWSIALVVWMTGALFLWKIWQFQKTLPDPLGSFIEFAVMFISTFYVVALIALKYCVNGLLCRGEQASPALINSGV